MRSIKGDLIKLALAGEFHVIVHGCNCFNTMGAGIAKGIKAAFPAAYKADCQTTKGDESKLGTCSYAKCPTPSGPVVVVNAYTQYRYGGGGCLVDYDAVQACFEWIADMFPDAHVGCPKIGAGLAGGDWDRIEQIIDGELGDRGTTVIFSQQS